MAIILHIGNRRTVYESNHEPLKQDSQQFLDSQAAQMRIQVEKALTRSDMVARELEQSSIKVRC